MENPPYGLTVIAQDGAYLLHLLHRLLGLLLQHLLLIGWVPNGDPVADESWKFHILIDIKIA